MKPSERKFEDRPAVLRDSSGRVATRRICGHCGQEYIRRASKTSLYCSKSCVWKATRGHEYNALIARQSASKRGATQRGRGTKGYVKSMGRHEHRAIAEELMGRPLERGEIVHHKDKNKHNNAPSNLEVMRRPEHMRVHGIGIPGMALWWKPWEKRRDYKGGQK